MKIRPADLTGTTLTFLRQTRQRRDSDQRRYGIDWSRRRRRSRRAQRLPCPGGGLYRGDARRFGHQHPDIAAIALCQLRNPDTLAFDYAHSDERRAVGLESEQLCRPARHIAAAGKRATIIDPQLHGAALCQIGHLHDARHRQCAMRRRQLVQIEDFAKSKISPFAVYC
jgi:hypothetical protein